MTEQEWLNKNQLSLDIWDKKYRVNQENFEDWLTRVSGGDEDIKRLIREKKFLFGGRILAGRGLKENKVTLSNCFVLPSPEDNLESIFTVAKMMARTFSMGGGCGINISKLRPKGAITHNAAKESTGPTSFMELYSYITGLISQQGRRGATMICMDCSHPDIEDFINLKSEQGVCEKANISLMVSDEFMNAVIQDKDWVTKFSSPEVGTITKTFRARDLLKLLAKRNWEWAEPGLLYWDRITNYNLNNNNSEYKLTATNPCGELPLQDGGACLLGSLNLSEFVLKPFTAEAAVNYKELCKAVQIVIKALNEVLDENIPTLPLEVQRNTASNWRPIGLGSFGMADMLIKLGIKYGSLESIEVLENVYHAIAVTAVQTSLELAKKDGSYPMCKNPQLITESSFIKALHLDKHTLNEINQYGLRNAQLLTCAPTGSIATMLQVSTGVEPNFALKYIRRTQSLTGKDTYYDVNAKIVDDYFNAIVGDHERSRVYNLLPDYFVESKDISPINRIKVQSILQTYIDNSISSTINLPESATIEDVYNIYIEAWKHGLKGCTVYRAHCYREGILTTDTPKEIKETKKVSKLNNISPIHRDDIGQVLTGNTYKYHTACGTLYITINKDEEGNIVEIFTNSSKNGTCKANLNGETRLASLALRAGVKVSEVADTLKSIQCQSCAYARAKGNKIDGTSCPDIIAKCITKDMKLEKPTTKVVDSKDLCPECQSLLEHVGGCIVCPNCSWSKCD